ncbi:metallophosphoesterase family protein [Glycomyces halotolerans]
MDARVAVLSDIHGVLPALEAVLEEPDVRSADRIVATGDIALGPQPVQTLDMLAELGDRLLWISGNAERDMVGHRREGGRTIPDPLESWSAEQLRDDQVDFLEGLPKTITRELPTFGTTLFCHATPRDDEEVVLVDSSLERWAEVFEGLDEEIRTVVCGHTHMPFVRMVDGRLVINPGSIGMPYGRAGAHWAMLADGVDLRVTEFDIEAAVARVIRECDHPKIEWWADYFLQARASDAEALEVFGRSEGRRQRS